jgi:hypothetical protein
MDDSFDSIRHDIQGAHVSQPLPIQFLAGGRFQDASRVCASLKEHFARDWIGT